MFILSKLLKDIKQYNELLAYLTISELKVNTARTYFGFLWWILDPLLYMGIFYLLIEIILRRGGPDYSVFLFIALIPLKWTISCLVDSTTIIISKARIIQQIFVPKIVFILVRLIVNTLKFLIGSVVLILFLWAYGIPITSYILFLPLIIFVHAVFLLAMMILLAHIGVYFKDMKNIMQYVTRMLYYLSPVLYSVNSVPENLARWIYLNPLTPLINSYRNILMYGTHPEWRYIMIWFIGSLIALYIGLKILFKYESQYAKVI